LHDGVVKHIVATPRGDAWVELDRPAGRAAPTGLLVLGHGASGGVGAVDLVAVRDAAVEAGIAVARVTQPYRVAGRTAPAPAAQLDEAWLAVIAAIRGGAVVSGRWPKTVPVVTGGRSSGARVACRTAVAAKAAGVLCLAFPLHPPGKPESSRAGELLSGVPTLVLNGDKDPFGVPKPSKQVRVVVRPGDRHDLKRRPAETAGIAVAWLAELGLTRSA
jgi:predicted alpha/beta-hydrolase family hydrolase